MVAKKKGHPLDSLTFIAPKLDEVNPAPASEVEPAAQNGMEQTPADAVPSAEEVKAAPPDVETRASNVILPVAIWNWIDAKHAEARRNGGKATRKAAIIRAVFEAVMGLDFDLSGSHSEEEIVRRIRSRIVQQDN